MNMQVSESKKTTISALLINQKKQIEAALPRHMTADRMLRIVMTEIRKNPKLKECDAASLIGAVIQCSQLGLEPGSALGHAWLIPYGRECQFIIGYRGMIDLARRSGFLVSISAHAVYSNDTFEFEYGIEEKLKHIPARGERGEYVGAYAIAKLREGGYQFVVMWKDSIDKIRGRSKAKNSGPWVTDYEEMGNKTVIRRLFKYLPVSIELQRAITLDEEADRGEQNNSFTIDGEFEETSSVPASKADKLADTLNKSKPAVTFEIMQEKIMRCNSIADLGAMDSLIKQVPDKEEQEYLLGMCQVRSSELKEATNPQ